MVAAGFGVPGRSAEWRRARDAAKKSIVQDLIEITSAAWRSDHGVNEKKRTTAVNALKERLRWKPWEEVR